MSIFLDPSAPLRSGRDDVLIGRCLCSLYGLKLTFFVIPSEVEESKNIICYLACMERGGAIYILTNVNRTVLYIGVTSDLHFRLIEHRQMKFRNSFTNKYKTTICIYYELFSTIEEAIDREKQLKKWRRDKKEFLINTLNPEWRDLWEDIKKW